MIIGIKIYFICALIHHYIPDTCLRIATFIVQRIRDDFSKNHQSSVDVYVCFVLKLIIFFCFRFRIVASGHFAGDTMTTVRGGHWWRCLWWLVFMLTMVHGWTPRNGSRIQINNRPADVSQTVFGGGHGRGQSAIKLGVLKNRLKEPVQLSTTPAATTTSTERFRRQPPTVPRIMARRQHQNLTVGLVLPYKTFDTRQYTKEVTSAIHGLQRNFKSRKTNIFKNYEIHHIIDMKQLTPTPTGQ